MLRGKMRIFKRFIFIADLFFIALSFQISFIINLSRLDEKYNVLEINDLFLPAIIIWGLVLWFHQDCYDIRLRSLGNILKSLLKASIIACGLLLSFVFVLKFQEESRLQIGMFSIFSFVSVAAFRLAITIALRFYRSRGYNYQVIVIVGTGSIAKKFANKVLSNPRIGWKILGFIDWEKLPDNWHHKNISHIGQLEELPEILKNEQVDRVIFAVGKKNLGKIESSLAICEQMGIQGAVLVDFFPTKFARFGIDSLFDIPFVCYDSAPKQNSALILKSAVDRISSLLAILLFSPLMLTAAFALKLSSRGTIVFKQERCGLNGRKFKLFKFRTMVKDAEKLKAKLMAQNEMDGPVFKITNDPRITPVGKFLRKTSIDELPQLFNVLKGEMSIIGPRPPLPEEVANYDLWQRRKLSMKPGITGLWQISARAEGSFEKWMKLDLKYIDNWSIWEDIKILFKTVPAVLKGTGAR